MRWSIYLSFLVLLISQPFLILRGDDFATLFPNVREHPLEKIERTPTPVQASDIPPLLPVNGYHIYWPEEVDFEIWNPEFIRLNKIKKVNMREKSSFWEEGEEKVEDNSFTFDESGNLIQYKSKYLVGGDYKMTVDFVYDNSGRLKYRNDHNGYEMHYSYANNSRVEKVNLGGRPLLVKKSSFDAQGRLDTTYTWKKGVLSHIELRTYDISRLDWFFLLKEQLKELDKVDEYFRVEVLEIEEGKLSKLVTYSIDRGTASQREESWSYSGKRIKETNYEGVYKGLKTKYKYDDRGFLINMERKAYHFYSDYSFSYEFY